MSIGGSVYNPFVADDEDDFEASLKRAMAAQKRHVFSKKRGYKKRKGSPYKPGSQKFLDKKARRLQAWLLRNGYTTRDLWAELGRRTYRARMEKLTAEERKAIAEKASASAAIARRYCDHSKFPPRLRKGGKHPGMWTCPSCRQVVPPPQTIADDDLVI